MTPYLDVQSLCIHSLHSSAVYVHCLRIRPTHLKAITRANEYWAFHPQCTMKEIYYAIHLSSRTSRSERPWFKYTTTEGTLNESVRDRGIGHYHRDGLLYEG